MSAATLPGSIFLQEQWPNICLPGGSPPPSGALEKADLPFSVVGWANQKEKKKNSHPHLSKEGIRLAIGIG